MLSTSPLTPNTAQSTPGSSQNTNQLPNKKRLRDIDEDDNEKTHRKTKKHKSSRKHKKHRTSSGRKSSCKTVKPIPEEIPETPPKQSPVFSGFTPINKSRKQNPVPPRIRTDTRTPPNINLAPSDTEGIFPSNWGATLTDSDSFPDFSSEPSEPYISDDQDPATGPATGPLAAVSTASSARSSASPEALVRTTVLRVSATPPAPASLVQSAQQAQQQAAQQAAQQAQQQQAQQQAAQQAQQALLLPHQHPSVLHRRFLHRRPLH
ncbi:hypothetical protein P167DRAFT_580086 [Morchella conica CCBAS932]|uniref:Uncharacterized protein n=1 Tax=Morchella conica CCBAS932 TaxID=1392247 RepID=A0A3N4KEF2_9PEZI|nr:hypothetical protein P167DRAFT_580086 [Morchella conica CCBAS932]